jgi:undecaprenyl-diphosphatase
MGVLAFAVSQGWTAEFDRLLLTSTGEAMRAAHWPIPLAIAITTIGSVGVRLPLAAFFAMLMSWRGDHEGGATVIITTIGTLILTALLKIAASRARPDVLPQLVLETSFSFPSGHSASSAAVFGILGWAAVRYGAPKSIVWVFVAVFVGLIGLSRIALAVHWPSDVLAGWLLGTGWLLVCVSCLRRKLTSWWA